MHDFSAWIRTVFKTVLNKSNQETFICCNQTWVRFLLYFMTRTLVNFYYFLVNIKYILIGLCNSDCFIGILYFLRCFVLQFIGIPWLLCNRGFCPIFFERGCLHIPTPPRPSNCLKPAQGYC